MSEPKSAEVILQELIEYLQKFPKHGTGASYLDCFEIKIITASHEIKEPILAVEGEESKVIWDYVSNHDPETLILTHSNMIKNIISDQLCQNKVCVVRTYPEVSGSIYGLKIRTRLHFGKASDILMKLLPPGGHA